MRDKRSRKRIVRPAPQLGDGRPPLLQPFKQIALFFPSVMAMALPHKSLVGWEVQVRAASAWRQAASRRGARGDLSTSIHPQPFRARRMNADALIRRRRGVRGRSQGNGSRVGPHGAKTPSPAWKSDQKPRSREMASKSGNGLSRIVWAALTLCLGGVGCHATFSFMANAPRNRATPTTPLPRVAGGASLSGLPNPDGQSMVSQSVSSRPPV